MNRYTKVSVVSEGDDALRVIYEGSCFICGAPVIVHKIWQCHASEIPASIKGRLICDQH